MREVNSEIVQDVSQVNECDSIHIVCVIPFCFLLPQPQEGQSSLPDQIDTQIEQLRCTITSKDQELARLDQALQLAELEKKKVIQGLDMTGQSIRSSKDKIAQLLQEKESLEELLNRREDEGLVLKLSSKSEVVMKEMSTKPEVVDRLVAAKEKEIAGLKRQLQSVRCKLEEAEAELSDYREKLLRELIAELKEKSKEMECLREANAQTKLELDLERAKVDKLRMQQTIAAEDEEKYFCEVEMRYSTVLMCECTCDKDVLCLIEADQRSERRSTDNVTGNRSSSSNFAGKRRKNWRITTADIPSRSPNRTADNKFV